MRREKREERRDKREERREKRGDRKTEERRRKRKRTNFASILACIFHHFGSIFDSWRALGGTKSLLERSWGLLGRPVVKSAFLEPSGPAKHPTWASFWTSLGGLLGLLRRS